MSIQNNIGAKGENLAKLFLEGIGFEILDCNWRHKHLEADIIAKEKNILVVVEVKTRTSNYFGEPEENVHQKKQDHLIEIANAYVETKNLEHEIRFDIVSVIIGNRKPTINHIRNAFSIMG
jgi:putative endonuclease